MEIGQGVFTMFGYAKTMKGSGSKGSVRASGVARWLGGGQQEVVEMGRR